MTDYADHIRDLIEQVLFTAPGERVNRPTFGCGGPSPSFVRWFVRQIGKNTSRRMTSLHSGRTVSRIEKTVFISYRRSTGAVWALAISKDLTHHGYDVFFDFQGIASGDFEQVILESIRARARTGRAVLPGWCGSLRARFTRLARFQLWL